jgi:hypothetical protein
VKERIITGLMLVIAIVHLLPITGFLGVEQLNALYGINVADGTLEILMRHRAMLFGILGVFFAFTAFRPGIQPIAFLAAFASIASFLFLCFAVGGYNEAMRKVVIADIVAAIALIAAIVIYVSNAKEKR